MDTWKEQGKSMAKLTLKVYHWMGNHEMCNDEKSKIAQLVTDTLVSLGKKAQRQEKLLQEIGVFPRGLTRVPFYDINFGVICGNPRYNFDMVQDSIVLFENIFGMNLETCSILDFKNHSFHDVSQIFSYAIGQKKRRRSSLENLTKSLKQTEGSTQNECEEEKSRDSFGKLLSAESDILNEIFIQKIQHRMPNYLRRCKWKLVYSTARHGISLTT